MTRSIPKLALNGAQSAEELLGLYRIETSHLEAIRSMRGEARPRIEGVIEHFYQWMGEHPAMMAFFETEDIMLHVRKMQTVYWERFLDANVNNEYLNDRRRIGEIHARIGLPVMFYIGAINMVYDELKLVAREIIQDASSKKRGDQLESVNQSLAGLIHLDAGLICQSFVDKRDQLLHEQSQAVMSMSTPVTEIWDGILLLPIVGLIDSRRSEDILNAVLNAIKQSKAKEFILDISGVGVVDTAVANYLISITKATALMGCRSTISGISPAISKTIIQLGIETDDVNTTSTMMDALSDAFANRGLAIKNRGKRKSH